VIDPLSDAAFTDLAGQGIAEADKTLRVDFFYDEIPDAKKTEEMGRPMFRSVEMCSIKIPGDKDNHIIGRVDRMNPDPRRRFAARYAHWKAGNATKEVEGTLLREWGLLDRAAVKSYEAVDVVTVEQLAGLSDATCQQYRGSLADRQRARDWLDKAKGLEPAAAARAENAALRSEIDALKEAIASLGGKVPEAPVPAVPKRRGRPPKVKPEEITQ
jgi:hypothetical protein